MFLFCILNYVRDNFLTPSAYQETCDFIPDWIDALIDDRDVASEAKQLYEAWAKREIAI